MEDTDSVLGIQLVTAAATGMAELVEAALATGADIHYEDDLALRSAVFTGNNNVVKLLVEKGANIHAAGEEALLYAAKRRDDEVVALLLEKGAVIDDMVRLHKRDLDRDCLETLDRHESHKLREAFEKNFAKIKKPDAGAKYKLKRRPPSP